MNNSHSNGGKQTVFTSKQYVAGGTKADRRSPKDHDKVCNNTKGDTVVIQKNGVIELKNGIRATAILAKCQNDTYEYDLLWPEINKNKKIHYKKRIVVIKDSEGELSILEDDNMPSGSVIEFKS